MSKERRRSLAKRTRNRVKKSSRAVKKGFTQCREDTLHVPARQCFATQTRNQVKKLMDSEKNWAER